MDILYNSSVIARGWLQKDVISKRELDSNVKKLGFYVPQFTIFLLSALFGGTVIIRSLVLEHGYFF